MRLPRAALAASVILLLAGCSGGKEEAAQTNAETPAAPAAAESPDASEPAKPVPVRKEFVVVREIVRQHALQAGNDKRMQAVESALRTRFPLLPDEGNTEEETRIYRQAEELLAKIDNR